MPSPRLPYDGMDMRTLLGAQSERHGERPFLIWEPFEGEGARWSYAEFVEAVRRFAAGLQARSALPGDRVLIHLDNCPEFLIAWLGCAWAGVVAVTSNTRLSAEEVAYVAAHSGVVGAVTQPAHAQSVRGAVGPDAWVALTETDAGAAAAEAPPPGAVAFAAITGDPDALPDRPHDPTASFGIQYTSGTTARPKAVLWTHANALWGAQRSAEHEDLGPADTHLVHLPLFHTNAQVYSVLAALWAGAVVVLMPRFSASRFWTVSLKHRCTFASMVGFCARALANHPVPERHHYRNWGSAVCDPPSDAHFGVKTIGWWGMTETMTHGIVGSTRLPNASNSMGRPAPGYEVFVLDPDGRPTPPGEVGDLFIRGVRGLSLFREYAGDPGATRAAFTADGLFITGDRVRVGAGGELYFADRSKDMLKVGGENVAASEVERVILTVPGVREAAVVGRPDPMLGETPVAFVIPADLGQADSALSERILETCGAALAAFKRPREVRIVETLPRAALEKVAKAELRKLLAAESSGPA
jgi:crotonobetaine/carnitine-CoA ligase